MRGLAVGGGLVGVAILLGCSGVLTEVEQAAQEAIANDPAAKAQIMEGLAKELKPRCEAELVAEGAAAADAARICDCVIDRIGKEVPASSLIALTPEAQEALVGQMERFTQECTAQAI